MKYKKEFKVTIEGFKNGKPTKNTRTISALSKQDLESKITQFREHLLKKYYQKNGIWWSFGRYYIQHETGNYTNVGLIPDNVLKLGTFEFETGEKYIVKVKGFVNRNLKPEKYRMEIFSENGILKAKYFKPKGKKIITSCLLHDSLLITKETKTQNGTIILKEYTGKL